MTEKKEATHAASRPADGVPDGFVLVPINPTKEMIALGDEIISEDFGRRVRPESIYDAMVNGASAPTSAQAGDEVDLLAMAQGLATSIWSQHYREDSPNWETFDNLAGVLSQISNMTSGMARIIEPTPDAAARASVQRDDELPGMWSSADLIGGMTDAESTATKLLRFGRGNGDTPWILEPRIDGYWTPWHVAQRELDKATTHPLTTPSDAGGDTPPNPGDARLSDAAYDRLRGLIDDLMADSRTEWDKSQDHHWSEWVRDRHHGKSSGLADAAGRLNELLSLLDGKGE